MVHLGYCMNNVYKLTSIKVDFFDMDHNVPGLEGQGSGLQHDTRYVHKSMRDLTKIPGVKPKSQALMTDGEILDSQLCFATEAPFWLPVGALFCSPGPGVTHVRIADRDLKSH